jgi:hypothetical protein
MERRGEEFDKGERAETRTRVDKEPTYRKG